MRWPTRALEILPGTIECGRVCRFFWSRSRDWVYSSGRVILLNCNSRIGFGQTGGNDNHKERRPAIVQYFMGVFALMLPEFETDVDYIAFQIQSAETIERLEDLKRMIRNDINVSKYSWTKSEENKSFLRDVWQEKSKIIIARDSPDPIA